MTRLKFERIKRGWNQTYLAALAGLSQTQVSAFERGTEPNPDQAARLARVVGVPADQLLVEVDAVEPFEVAS